jgi:hypothetical protein
MRELEILATQNLVRAGQRLLDWSKQKRERGAEFVADVIEEGGFNPIDFGQRIGALALLLTRSRIGNRRGDLIDGKLTKPR